MMDEKEYKIWGCGRFTIESYNIFCKDKGRSMSPDDATLRMFVSWLKKASQSEDSGVTSLSEDGARPQC